MTRHGAGAVHSKGFQIASRSRSTAKRSTSYSVSYLEKKKKLENQNSWNEQPGCSRTNR